MLLRINPDHPQPRVIDKAVEVLTRGGVIVYPTETAYGLGCSIHNKKSIDWVYKIKNKDRKKPSSFVCSGLKDLDQYAIVTNSSFRLLRRYLPGPYTFVLQATRLVPKMMITRRRTVGIRVPECAAARALVEALGDPILSTSVDPGEGILNEPREIHRRMGKQVDLVLDGGAILYQMSSIVDLTGDEPLVLREGIGDVDEFL